MVRLPKKIEILITTHFEIQVQVHNILLLDYIAIITLYVFLKGNFIKLPEYYIHVHVHILLDSNSNHMYLRVREEGRSMNVSIVWRGRLLFLLLLLAAAVSLNLFGHAGGCLHGAEE